MNGKKYVRFMRHCKGFAYVQSSEVWVDADKIEPYLKAGYAVEIEPPKIMQPEYRTAAMQPQRGRPKKEA